MTKTTNYNLNKIETTDNIIENIQQLGENAEIIDNVLYENANIANDSINKSNEAISIAKGRATGYVFDTLEDLEIWLEDDNNIANLILGDNLYIRAIDVPDYWWDGNSKQKLETQKVDLEEYLKRDELSTIATQSVVTNFWSGTQTEYDALGTYDDTTLYLINEE